MEKEAKGKTGPERRKKHKAVPSHMAVANFMKTSEKAQRASVFERAFHEEETLRTRKPSKRRQRREGNRID